MTTRSSKLWCFVTLLFGTANLRTLYSIYVLCCMIYTALTGTIRYTQHYKAVMAIPRIKHQTKPFFIFYLNWKPWVRVYRLLSSYLHLVKSPDAIARYRTYLTDRHKGTTWSGNEDASPPSLCLPAACCLAISLPCYSDRM